MKKGPVCFVAMAFGKDDCDLFYEKQILPVLKRNGVKPVIINRHQSNDDLNLQIFGQLEQADFCIADLTYTRPSVYFEAGYAQRAIPVIYTVRKDHLGKGQPDDLRVHFDLQMKPIVVWANPTDPTFSPRLEKRLHATVRKDWSRDQKKNGIIEIAKNQFQQLPQYSKLVQIRRLALYQMRRAGIKLSNWKKVEHSFTSDTSNHTGDYGRKSIIGGNIDHIFGSVEVSGKIIEVSLQSYNSLNKKDLWDLQGAYYAGVYSNDLRKQYPRLPVFSHNIVLSLRSVASSQIESVMSSFSPLIKARRYVLRYDKRSSYDSTPPRRQIFNTFHFLSGIESEYHLKELLKDLIDGYILEQIKQKNY